MRGRFRRGDWLFLLILLGAGLPAPMLLADSSRLTAPPRPIRPKTAASPASSLVVTVQVVPAAPIPLQFALAANYPNPFHATMSFKIECPIDGHVTVMVFGATGRRVTTLLDEQIPAGTRTLVWSGRDDAGTPAPSGVYFYRMAAGKFVTTRKAILVR